MSKANWQSYFAKQKKVAKQVENMIKRLLKKHDSYDKRDKEFKLEKVFSREYL